METSHKKLWRVTWREEVGKNPYNIRGKPWASLWTELCCSGESNERQSKVIIGMMISSGKRRCDKYLSFPNDGEVFHLRLYPQGELLTAVAQWCQVLFGSVDIDYLSCSKLSYKSRKMCLVFFLHSFQIVCELFWPGKPCTHPESEL